MLTGITTGLILPKRRVFLGGIEHSAEHPALGTCLGVCRYHVHSGTRLAAGCRVPTLAHNYRLWGRVRHWHILAESGGSSQDGEGGGDGETFHRRPGRIAFYFGNDFWHFVTPHGLKNTSWMIKYPHIKKNAACQNTHRCPGSETAPKSGLAQVYLIFEKFAAVFFIPC